MGLKETLYALDSTTIDLCRSLVPSADFRSTKAAIKAHTVTDLRGLIHHRLRLVSTPTCKPPRRATWLREN